MKKSTFIATILLFNWLTILVQTNKLPIPTKSFIEKARHQDNSEEIYFSKYLGKKSEHILKRFSDSKDVCAKKCEFKTGIILKTNSCSEAGPRSRTNPFVWAFKTALTIVPTTAFAKPPKFVTT